MYPNPIHFPVLLLSTLVNAPAQRNIKTKIKIKNISLTPGDSTCSSLYLLQPSLTPVTALAVLASHSAPPFYPPVHHTLFVIVALGAMVSHSILFCTNGFHCNE